MFVIYWDNFLPEIFLYSLCYMFKGKKKKNQEEKIKISNYNSKGEF